MCSSRYRRISPGVRRAESSVRPAAAHRIERGGEAPALTVREPGAVAASSLPLIARLPMVERPKSEGSSQVKLITSNG